MDNKIITKSDVTARAGVERDAILADSVKAGDIASTSIVNSGAITTKTIEVNQSATINGAIYAKSSLGVDGSISTDGDISATSGTIKTQKLLVKKGNTNVLSTDDNGNVIVYGNLNASTNGSTAKFSYNTVIGAKAINSSTTEGYVQATNLIAGKRLCVGTGNQVVIDDANCKFGSNKYTGYFGELKIAGDSLLNSIQVTKEANINTLRVTGDSFLKNLTISGNLNVDGINTDNISVENIVASYSIKSKDFTFTGSGKVGESVTILGANSDGYGLNVVGGTIIANKGIRAYNGLNEFGCLKINGQDKVKCKIAGTEYGFFVADGIPSLFKGDVYLNDSNMVFDNSTLFASDVLIVDVNALEKNKRYSNVNTISEGLQIVANAGDNIWTTWKRENISNITCEYAETSFDETEPILIDEMEAEFDAEWTPETEEVERTVRGMDANVIKKLKAAKCCTGCNSECDENACICEPVEEKISLNPLETNFELKDGKYFRIDSGGHAFLKEVVAEDGSFSTLRAHDMVVNNISTSNIRCNGIQANESLGSLKAFYARGISRFTGKVYNYADNYFKHAAKLTLQDQAKLVVEEGATVEIGGNAKFSTDSFSTVNLDGNITLNIDKLVLKDNEGHSIKLTLKTVAEGSDEGEEGDIILGYQETI